MDNIVRIRVGRYTKKGPFETFADFVVSTTSTKTEIEAVYKKRYAGLMAVVDDVENVVIEEDAQETFRVRDNNGYAVGSSTYKVTVSAALIDGFTDLCRPVDEAKAELEAKKKALAMSIAEKLRINYEAVKQIELFPSYVELSVDRHKTLMDIRK